MKTEIYFEEKFTLYKVKKKYCLILTDFIFKT